jgi:hypothetical protein
MMTERPSSSSTVAIDGKHLLSMLDDGLGLGFRVALVVFGKAVASAAITAVAWAVIFVILAASLSTAPALDVAVAPGAAVIMTALVIGTGGGGGGCRPCAVSLSRSLVWSSELHPPASQNAAQSSSDRLSTGCADEVLFTAFDIWDVVLASPMLTTIHLHVSLHAFPRFPRPCAHVYSYFPCIAQEQTESPQKLSEYGENCRQV